jgi:hypothetical protein
MTLTREMGRKGARSGLDTKCILRKCCDEDAPQLITPVQTTPAPNSDKGVLSAIHADLAEKELLPDQHLVDAGYTTLANLVKSRSDHEVDLIGPTLKTHWYQAETGYDLTHFSIDWEAETDTFKDTYRHRAGIEGTHSEASAHDGTAALALYWSAQNASGSCGYSCRRQYHSINELATRRRTGADPHFSLQTGHEAGSLRGAI